MVKVRAIAEMGAYVNLAEYNNIEGMILLSELSRRRIRSINKLIRVDRNECVVVLRVDKEKGYIDLSKRRVSPEEAAKCEEKYQKARAINSVLRHVAEISKVDLEELYALTAWKVEKKHGPGSSYDIFKAAITDDSKLLEELELAPDLMALFLSNLRRRLAPQPIKIRSDIEVACYSYEGINTIKEALRAGLACSTEDLAVKINLIAPPLYVVTTISLDKDVGVDLLKTALKAITATITAKGGSIHVVMEPRAVSETEDKELTTMMEKYEQENTEVAGDSGDDEDGAAPSVRAAAKGAAAAAAEEGEDDEEDGDDGDGGDDGKGAA